MLDGARNADRDVKLGCDDFAGLTDLVIVWDKPRVNGRSGRADRGAELVSDFLQQMEVVARLHAAAAGNYNPCTG